MADQLNKNSDSIIVASGVKHPITKVEFVDGTASFTIYEALTTEQLDLWDRPGGVGYEDLTALAGAEDIAMGYNAAMVGTVADAQFYGTLPKTVGDTLTIGDMHPCVITVTKAGATTTGVRLYKVAYNRGENAP